MRILLCISFLMSMLALVSCGGGGSGTSTQSSATTYQSVATEGELVSYQVDTTNLTYSYEIIESAYGKTGVTGSGTLTRNADGTYTPSAFAGKIVVLESGLLLGAIYEDLNGDNTDEVIPVMGVANPVNTFTGAAGTYNFISRQCGTNNCENYYGTFSLADDGRWTSCLGANLSAANFTCQNSVTGETSGTANGVAAISVNGTTAGSLIIFRDPTTGQKVILLDLNGQTGLGQGAIYASTQQLPSNVDGDWSYLHTDGTRGTVTVSGTSFTDSGIDSEGTTYTAIQGTFTLNTPWNGFVTTSDGAVLMPAGSGFYAGYFGQNGTISVGLQK
jgi:hypothetical protein